MPRGKTVVVARREAQMYVRKAEQFLDEAQEAVAAERYDAALLTAIHAAICAADAVTVVLAGRRSSDPDHQRATDLLEEVVASTPGSRERVRQLRGLLSRKNAVEYESRRATAREARDSVERASRLVKWAVEIVERARF